MDSLNTQDQISLVILALQADQESLNLCAIDGEDFLNLWNLAMENQESLEIDNLLTKVA